MKDCVAGRIFDGGVAIFVPRDPRGNSRVAKPRGKSTRQRYQNRQKHSREKSRQLRRLPIHLFVSTDGHLSLSRKIYFVRNNLIRDTDCQTLLQKTLVTTMPWFQSYSVLEKRRRPPFSPATRVSPPATFVRQSRRK